MLSNLQFSTEYFIALRSEPSLNAASQDNMPNAVATSPALERKFLTPACNEIFGPGSLDCGMHITFNTFALLAPPFPFIYYTLNC